MNQGTWGVWAGDPGKSPCQMMGREKIGRLRGPGDQGPASFPPRHRLPETTLPLVSSPAGPNSEYGQARPRQRSPGTSGQNGPHPPTHPEPSSVAWTLSASTEMTGPRSRSLSQLPSVHLKNKVASYFTSDMSVFGNSRELQSRTSGLWPNRRQVQRTRWKTTPLKRKEGIE